MKIILNFSIDITNFWFKALCPPPSSVFLKRRRDTEKIITTFGRDLPLLNFSLPLWKLSLPLFKTKLCTPLHRNYMLYNLQYYLYTWNLKYHYLKPVFSILNMHLEFTICTHKFKCLFNIEKPCLNAVFKLSDIQNQIIIRFGMANSQYTF